MTVGVHRIHAQKSEVSSNASIGKAPAPIEAVKMIVELLNDSELPGDLRNRVHAVLLNEAENTGITPEKVIEQYSDLIKRLEGKLQRGAPAELLLKRIEDKETAAGIIEKLIGLHGPFYPKGGQELFNIFTVVIRRANDLLNGYEYIDPDDPDKKLQEPGIEARQKEIEEMVDKLKELAGVLEEIRVAFADADHKDLRYDDRKGEPGVKMTFELMAKIQSIIEGGIFAAPLYDEDGDPDGFGFLKTDVEAAILNIESKIKISGDDISTNGTKLQDFVGKYNTSYDTLSKMMQRIHGLLESIIRNI